MRLHGAINDRRGVAAVEFALLLPVMLVLYFGTMEFSQAIETHKKASRVGAMVSDLVGQLNKATRGELDAIMEIGEVTLLPYNRSRPSIYITAIDISDDDMPKATVAWSRKMEDGATSRYLPEDQEITDVPAALNVRNSFLIRVESDLTYQPILTWNEGSPESIGLTSLFDSIEMHEDYHVRPRMTQRIMCEDC
ncbi:TadE/TadG family type IV pilus assembly protein [Mesorhizobium xinjiangense]|uniref:TadE/TadG family type IV pilus assembly protein n=1 Tax=Mesorhizobium xinjiangense TaxID=2678685 RepID=UPI001F181329|nr:TadE/TadG family type IV pilus assembly protein [Mesorhizobium xinjiangense]